MNHGKNFCGIVFCAITFALAGGAIGAGKNESSGIVEALFAQSDKPEEFAALVAREAKTRPEEAEGLCVAAIEIFSRKLEGDRLAQAVSSLFEEVGRQVPEVLLGAIGKAVSKYPTLAVAIAAGGAKGAPEMWREIAETVMKFAPGTNPKQLEKAFSGNTNVTEGFFDSFLGGEVPGTPIPSAAGAGGGGGGGIYSR